MNRYFVRRLLATIPLMFIISIFVFMFIHLIPGDPAKTLAGVEASVEEVEAIREEFGLNKPILVQYVDYMKNLFHGDMGRSLKSNLPVTEMIASRMHYTLRLVVAGMIWRLSSESSSACSVRSSVENFSTTSECFSPSPAFPLPVSGWV